jgi:hypothetical protein
LRWVGFTMNAGIGLHDLAGLYQLFKAAQVILYLLSRFFAEEFG